MQRLHAQENHNISTDSGSAFSAVLWESDELIQVAWVRWLVLEG